MNTEAPVLSVVVVTRDTAVTLQPILKAFGTQPHASQMEMVIVAPTVAAGTPSSQYAAPFLRVHVVATTPIINRGRAAASGVRACTAPIVALSENHCFPAPDWSERLLAAFAVSDRVGVGPSVRSANTAHSLGRVSHATGYGMYSPHFDAGPREELALHNSAFRREAVLPMADQLESMLGDERNMWSALRAQGHTVWFDPSCRKTHINESTWPLILGLAWCGGRRYGSVRSAQWPTAKRLAYALAGPLITVPVFRNIWKIGFAPNDASDRLRPIDAFTASVYAAVHAAGEATAYFLGAGGEFPFIEAEEFLIRDRLGGGQITDERVAQFVNALDDTTVTSPA